MVADQDPADEVSSLYVKVPLPAVVTELRAAAGACHVRAALMTLDVGLHRQAGTGVSLLIRGFEVV